MPARGRIDVHGHLLPNLDDGSRSVAESVEIAQRMAEAGYTHLTCSPHIWPERVYHPQFIRDRVAELQACFDAQRVPVTLIPGGELNLTDLSIFSMKDDEIATYGMAGKYVLFDFWAGTLPRDYWKRIARLRKLRAIPVQAHPERIAVFQDQPELLDVLADRGVLLQCNLQCLSDLAGQRMRRCAIRWLREKRYFALGSDVHRIDTLDVRLQGLERAIELLGPEEVDRLTITNPAQLVGLDPQPLARSDVRKRTG